MADLACAETHRRRQPHAYQPRSGFVRRTALLSAQPIVQWQHFVSDECPQLSLFPVFPAPYPVFPVFPAPYPVLAVLPVPSEPQCPAPCPLPVLFPLPLSVQVPLPVPVPEPPPVLDPSPVPVLVPPPVLV